MLRFIIGTAFLFQKGFPQKYGPASVNKSFNFLAIKFIPKDFNKKIQF